MRQEAATSEHLIQQLQSDIAERDRALREQRAQHEAQLDECEEKVRTAAWSLLLLASRSWYL